MSLTVIYTDTSKRKSPENNPNNLIRPAVRHRVRGDEAARPANLTWSGLFLGVEVGFRFGVGFGLGLGFDFGLGFGFGSGFGFGLGVGVGVGVG